VQLTWADLHLFATVDAIRELTPQAAEVVKKYPRISQLVDRVAAVPKIAEYLTKRGK
jgi:Glutathione S-transferase, C-terminal domain